MRYIIFLILLFGACSAGAADLRIFPIGDSRWNKADDYAFVYPPRGYEFDTTGYGVVTYGGKRLADWQAGRGTGTCTNAAPYGCLEAAPEFDVILIYGLLYNDAAMWPDCVYESAQDYADAWRTFYQTVHTDFPNAHIVHVTMYPVRVSGESCWFTVPPSEEHIITYGGTTVATEPTCEDEDYFIHANSYVHYIKNLLIQQNADLQYVHYLDTWRQVTETYTTDLALNAWIDIMTTDCIHMEGKNWPYWYNTFLRSGFEGISLDNVTLDNVVMQ